MKITSKRRRQFHHVHKRRSYQKRYVRVFNGLLTNFIAPSYSYNLKNSPVRFLMNLAFEQYAIYGFKDKKWTSLRC